MLIIRLPSRPPWISMEVRVCVQTENSRDEGAGKTGSGRSDTTTSSLEPILWRNPIMSRSSLTDVGGHSVVHRLGDSH